MLHLRSSAIGLAVILSLVAVGWYAWTRSLPVVDTVVVSRGPAIDAIYATGTVEPEYWAKISPPVTGRIQSILVSEGDKVAQGQLLARLDDREARANLEQLEARLRYWQEEQNRQKTLAERGVASREAKEKAQSEFMAAQAAVVAARQRLVDYSLIAPINGIVLRRDGEIGEIADKDSELFWVGRPRPLRISAEIDEEDIAKVQSGQIVLIKADAFPDQVFRGTVSVITPKGDPLNKTFRVRVAVPDDVPVMIGMTTEINIVIRQIDSTLLIPATAVTKDGKVFKIDEGKAVAHPVTLGIRGRGMVQILNGLTEQDRIIQEPSSRIADGQRVRLRQMTTR